MSAVMPITFDTLEYVKKLKAADVPEKQAEAQAEALRGVLETALAEQTQTQAETTTRTVDALDTKTEKATLQLGTRIELVHKELDAKIELVRKEIEVSRKDIIIKLGTMMVAGFGAIVAVLFRLLG